MASLYLNISVCTVQLSEELFPMILVRLIILYTVGCDIDVCEYIIVNRYNKIVFLINCTLVANISNLQSK